MISLKCQKIPFQINEINQKQFTKNHSVIPNSIEKWCSYPRHAMINLLLIPHPGHWFTDWMTDWLISELITWLTDWPRTHLSSLPLIRSSICGGVLSPLLTQPSGCSPMSILWIKMHVNNKATRAHHSMRCEPCAKCKLLHPSTTVVLSRGLPLLIGHNF